MDNQNSTQSKATKAYEIFCGVLLLVAVSFSILEIIGRLFFSVSYDFLIDLPVWLTAWATLLMTGPLLYIGGHVSIEIVKEKLKGKPRLAVSIFNNLFALIYGAIISIGGVQLVFHHFSEYSVFPRYIPIPRWWVELCVPLAMIIFTICGLLVFIREIRKKW
jgi:TRAP-type C4-dicarboxylate transport system permease small subunit